MEKLEGPVTALTKAALEFGQDHPHFARGKLQVSCGPRTGAAWYLAAVGHQDQSYGSHGYLEHLEAVARRVSSGFPLQGDRGYQTHEDALCTALLHDLLEDTEVTPEEVEEVCGARVRVWVQALTATEGNRKQRLRQTCDQILSIQDPGHQVVLVLVKLADRICNIRACWNDMDSRLFMYEKEQGLLVKRLGVIQHHCLVEPWGELDRLLGRTKK